MYFVKLWGGAVGANVTDPRLKTFAEFHCSLCGEDTDIDVTRVKDTFQFNRERKCPCCGQICSGDKEKNTKATIEKLTAEKSRIEVQIQKLIEELDEVNKN